jgi:hypothetical protein
MINLMTLRLAHTPCAWMIVSPTSQANPMLTAEAAQLPPAPSHTLATFGVSVCARHGWTTVVRQRRDSLRFSLGLTHDS